MVYRFYRHLVISHLLRHNSVITKNPPVAMSTVTRAGNKENYWQAIAPFDCTLWLRCTFRTVAFGSLAKRKFALTNHFLLMTTLMMHISYKCYQNGKCTGATWPWVFHPFSNRNSLIELFRFMLLDTLYIVPLWMKM